MHIKTIKGTHTNNSVSLIERRDRNKHNSGILYFTGFSGSLKSSLMLRLEEKLFNEGIQIATLNNTIVREGLCSDLEKTKSDTKENLRRAIELSLLMANAGWVVLADYVSCGLVETDLFQKYPKHTFHEVFLQLNSKTRADIFLGNSEHTFKPFNQNILLAKKKTKSYEEKTKKYLKIELSSQNQFIEEVAGYVCKEFLFN